MNEKKLIWKKKKKKKRKKKKNLVPTSGALVLSDLCAAFDTVDLLFPVSILGNPSDPTDSAARDFWCSL